jgi:putative serine protease PepD
MGCQSPDGFVAFPISSQRGLSLTRHCGCVSERTWQRLGDGDEPPATRRGALARPSDAHGSMPAWVAPAELDFPLPPRRPLPDPDDPKRPRRRTLAAALIAALLGAGLGIGLTALFDTHAIRHAVSPPSSSAAAGTGLPGATTTADRLAQALLPSVVEIQVVTPNGDVRQGSGLVISADGAIATAGRLVANADGGVVLIAFGDGRIVNARFRAVDKATGLALLWADGVSGLRPAPIGDPAALREGQQVFTVGAPYGMPGRLALGTVITLPGSGAGGAASPTAEIGTDFAISPGCTGGPLVNAQGQVVGITVASTANGQAGTTWAVPISAATSLLRATSPPRQVAPPLGALPHAGSVP